MQQQCRCVTGLLGEGDLGAQQFDDRLLEGARASHLSLRQQSSGGVEVAGAEHGLRSHQRP